MFQPQTNYSPITYRHSVHRLVSNGFIHGTIIYRKFSGNHRQKKLRILQRDLFRQLFLDLNFPRTLNVFLVLIHRWRYNGYVLEIITLPVKVYVSIDKM